MKKNAIANRDSQILIFIHIILTSFVLYFVLTGGGCEKKEELGEASPGPEVELTDIAKAYFKSTENSAEDLLTTNYSSLYEINQRVELGQTLKFVDTKRTIKCILRNGTQTQIALAIDTIFYDQYGNIVERKPSRDYILDTYSLDTTGRPVSEGDYCPSDNETKMAANSLKPPLTTLANKIINSVPNESMSHSLNFLAQAIASDVEEFNKRSSELGESDAKEIVKVTFHNLKVEDLTLTPPKKVQQKPGCSGIANCTFQAKQIQFDIVEWYSSTDYRKTRSRWVVTPQLPSFPEGMIDGFGGFISKCESGFQTIVIEDEDGNPTEREYLITTCAEVLRNF